jgi:hypothetical protein
MSPAERRICFNLDEFGQHGWRPDADGGRLAAHAVEDVNARLIDMVAD